MILQKLGSGHWFWVKLNFVGLLLNTDLEGKSLENTLFFLNCNISEKFDVNLMWSFLVVILQKLVYGLKKTKFLWPTSKHKDPEFGERSIVPQWQHTREA